MITFALRCLPNGHGFDGWFKSSEDYERQRGAGLVSCPLCGAHEVEKALMKPAVGSSVAGEQRRREYANKETAKAYAKLQELAREVRAKADYVGPRFAEEARRIHHGESETRRIYGEASLKEVKGLAEEGIAALPLPPLPEDAN